MKKIYLVLFVILSVFVFSCKDNLISDDLSSNQNSGVGQVKVFVKQSRLIGPELSDVSWDVKLLKDNENDTISGKNENGYYLFSGLSDGTYTITVFGKIGEVEKFTGSAKVTITNGNSVSVNVPIVAQKGTADVVGTGYATITMDMSDKLLSLLNSMGSNAYFSSVLVAGDNDPYYIASLVESESSTTGYESIKIRDNISVGFMDVSGSANIPTGYYYLTFSGLDMFNYAIKLKDNLVEIGDGLTTNIVLTENDYEIVRDYSTVLYVNEYGAGVNATGSSLSDPIAFSKISGDNKADLIYLLSDVEFANEDGSLSPNIESFFGTISSFNSTVRTISANIPDYSRSITLGYVTTLKNIKLSGSNAFYFDSLNIDETVILDCNLDAYKPVVCLSKSSNLVVGKNFSGDLYLSLNGDWKLGDTVINFENGKPENSNFYIESECENSSGQNYSSMFYIDDSGKLAKLTDDFTSFAWTRNTPHLVTKTQAKNKTYTSIVFNFTTQLNFTGISTYDGNNTWYFIGRDDSGSLIPYSVTLTDKYTNSVEAEPVFASIGRFDIQAMSYDAGKFYFGSKSSDEDSIQLNLSFMEGDNRKSCSVPITSQDYYIGDLTSLLVKGNEVYFATTVTSTNGQTNNLTTHSAIWKYELTMEETDNGTFYNLIPVQTYQGDDYPVPYYLTHSDIELTVNGSLPEGSTFRITDLYSDGNSVYGLLANYIEKQGLDSVGEDDKNKSFMRGSVFKLEQNTSRQNNSSDPIMNATQLELRKSFPLTSENLATAKQYFILPRKIVGILNKKLVIVDDGMVPDSNGCNVDRFVLFDLAGEISETIDVGTSFTTEASVSSNKFFTFDPLFDAQ